MQRSEQINELAAALAKAQAMMKPATKDSTNPHFKSRYSDLASVMDALREPLSTNGLALLQPASTVNGDAIVTTVLAHSSGQWMSDVLTLTPIQKGPQAVGSAITYGRRYGAMAITGLSADDDDDGQQASTPQRSRPRSAPPPRRDEGPVYDATPEDVPFQGPPAVIGDDDGIERYAATPQQRALLRTLAKPYGIDSNKDLHALSSALLGPPAVEMEHIAAAVKEWVDDRSKRP